MVLTCSTTDGTMEWLYNGVVILGSVFAESLDQVGASRSSQASGYMFSAELISIRPPVFATTVSFSADRSSNIAGDYRQPGHNLTMHLFFNVAS